LYGDKFNLWSTLSDLYIQFETQFEHSNFNVLSRFQGPIAATETKWRLRRFVHFANVGACWRLWKYPSPCKIMIIIIIFYFQNKQAVNTIGQPENHNVN